MPTKKTSSKPTKIVPAKVEQKSDLSTRAMLVTLNISSWQATRTDKKISEDVARDHNVSQRRAGRYRKHAIDVEAPTYKAVINAQGEARRTHYWYTVPWGQDGLRILLAATFPKYSEIMREKISAIKTAVAAFKVDYPRLKEAAKSELNGMWDAKDYPLDIGSKFDCSLSVMPLADADDFRCRLADADVAVIKSNIEEQLRSSTALAMREPYERLFDHLTRMVERLTDPDNKFKDTLVTGLLEICEILPALNLTGDPQLTVLSEKAAALVRGVDAQILRDDMTQREIVAKGAAEIVDTMAAFMGAQS